MGSLRSRGDPSRAFAPLLDPGRTGVASPSRERGSIGVTDMARASDDGDFGPHSRSFSTCSPTLRASCCHSRARLPSRWLANLYREGVDPLDRSERFQIICSSSFSVVPTLREHITSEGARADAANAAPASMILIRYCRTISTRRFCGSRTLGPVGTSRSVWPKPWMEMALAGTPSRTSSPATACARRSERPML